MQHCMRSVPAFRENSGTLRTEHDDILPSDVFLRHFRFPDESACNREVPTTEAAQALESGSSMHSTMNIDAPS